MIQRIISGLALFLGAGLYGCSTAAERPAPPANAATDRGTYICNLQMIDVHNGWASTGLVAGHSLLLRTTNGGESWRDCSPRGIPVDVDADATGCFLGAENAWLPTYERTTHTAGLLRTTNGGSAWVWFRFMTPAPSTPAAFQSVHFYTAKNGIASETDVGLGSADCQFYETQDGGANWFPLPIFPPGADPDADDMPTMIHLCNLCGDSVAFHPPANVIITHGDMGDETPKNGVRLSISDNMGRNWRDVKLPLPSEKFRNGLAESGPPVFLDDKNGWLPAQFRENDGDTFPFMGSAFYSTHDGGQTWTPMPGLLEAASGCVGGAVDFVSATDIFVCGGANLYVTHDGAKSWQTIKPNIDFGRAGSKREVSQIDFVDAAHGWMILYDNSNDLPDGHDSLYRTSDGGATWTELPLKIAP
jgi:photosystem II stability/assembly factor-like uncharacterized protein